MALVLYITFVAGVVVGWGLGAFAHGAKQN